MSTFCEEKTTACVENADVFLHPMLDDDFHPRTLEERHQRTMLRRKAENLCLDCPMMIDCLMRAVTEHDVAGIVGGTTPEQRSAMRAELGIRVRHESLDALVGLGGKVDHDELIRMRARFPKDSLENIARRLNCSVSTVKRHLRQERNDVSAVAPVEENRRVTAHELMDAYVAVTTPARQTARRKAA